MEGPPKDEAWDPMAHGDLEGDEEEVPPDERDAEEAVLEEEDGSPNNP